MLNAFLFILHIGCMGIINLFFLRIGLFILSTWLCVVALTMNLFIVKQITLFSLDVTTTDALTVGYFLGLSLIQEYFGKKEVRKHIWTCLAVSLGFVLLSQIHLLYTPNFYDTTQECFQTILGVIPRIIGSSLFSFLMVQFFDIHFFNFLRKKMKEKYFPLRCLICLSLSQIMDSFIFSFLGLYGIIEDVWNVIFLSLALRMIVIIFSFPFLELARFFVKKKEKEIILFQ